MESNPDLPQGRTPDESPLYHRDWSDQILNQMGEGFMLIGPDWKILKANAEGLRLLQHTSHEVIGRSHWNIWPGDVGHKVEAAYKDVAKTQTARILELNFSTEDSQNLWWEMRISSLQNEGLAVFFRDVTEQKRAALALIHSEEHLSALFEQTAAGIAERDLKGRLVRVNQRLCQILGRSREELLGVDIHDLTHPDDLARSEAAFNKLLADGRPFDIEKRYLKPDGTAVWVNTTVSLIRDLEGQSTNSVLAVILDINERKKAAEERQRLLTSERAARAEAERLNRAKDEFLAMLAHELRNPLAPVSAAAELLRVAGNDANSVQQVADIIARQIGHFTHLIDDLMDVSRVTRGLIQLDLEPLDLKTIINTALEQVRPMIEARQHFLITRTHAEHVMVNGDRTRLVQIVTNLLTNAAKYTPPGGEINLEVEAHEDLVNIIVSDNGSGIDAALLPYIFDLFTQGNRGLDRSQGGLGIGLALVKALVTLHQGEVRAFSKGAGHGSRFSVCFPRIQADRASFKDARGNDFSCSDLAILVVDDNVDAAKALAMLLTAIGHRVTVLTSAQEVLNQDRLEDFDVFILDIGLPDMSGYDLVKTLRLRANLACKTYVALTGYGQPQDMELSRNAGFAHHFVKPVSTPLLFKALAEVAAHRAAS